MSKIIRNIPDGLEASYADIKLDTIADLVNLTGTPPEIIWVSGYHTKGDGSCGSHIFEWDPNSTEPHNGGTIIELGATFPNDWSDQTQLDTWFNYSGGTTGRYKLKFDSAVNVKWFGAVGDGIIDDTTSFNHATSYSIPIIGNEDGVFRGGIFAPKGRYKIEGTVYVRKGQELYGDSEGGTYVDIPTTSDGHHTFKLGYGLVNGIDTQDGGGLPPIISNIYIIGGDASGAVINSTVPGSKIRNVFVTSCGIGINAGNDCIIENCIIDQGLNGISLSGQNVIVSECLFYNLNYGIVFNSNSYDMQVNDCHFEYTKYTDIYFNDGATNISNISISNCQFISNTQYSTKTNNIQFRSNSADVIISNCSFRNSVGYSIARTNGIDNNVKIFKCVFDGLKTNASYDQSATAKAINLAYGTFIVNGCSFKNLYGNPIKVDTYGILKLSNSNYKSLNSADYLVELNGGSAIITSCIGDNVTPIVSLGSFTLKNNLNHLGAEIHDTTNSKFVKKIPSPNNNGESFVISVTANSNPDGNLAYRMNSTFLITKTIEYDGSNMATKVNLTSIYEAQNSYIPTLNVQIDLDTVGNGVWSTGNNSKYILISVPDSYSNFDVEIID